VPSAPPDGEPAPSDGRLPDAALKQVGQRPFAAYVHVPFCATRCGYCDFNTYTAGELQGVSQQQYLGAVLAEVDLARRVLPHAPPLSSVFFGGGTPTLLPPEDLRLMLSALSQSFGLRDDVEVTTEANPESVTAASLRELRASGVNRISFGMQSAVPHVLATLDRVHTAGRVADAVREARAAGLGRISVDLIYGTPGESLDDWRVTLDAALALEPDHVSAYSLIVEPGTALARRITRGELAEVDADQQADMYLMAEEAFSRAGLRWYEVSNWARTDDQQCEHNLSYWRGEDWWGFGPGAHSHVAGVRWWNVKHPRAYAERLASGSSPAQARELLDADTRRVERVLLEVRLGEGLDTAALDAAGTAQGVSLVSEGLLEPDAWASGRAVLTVRGRLLADLVVRRLLVDV
jgi:putative oxygen-independent coproporphyrinogen III oxidase